MYMIIVLACLVGEPQCTPFQEDPLKYYFTEEACQKELLVKLNDLANIFTEQKQSGELKGRCMYLNDLKQA